MPAPFAPLAVTADGTAGSLRANIITANNNADSINSFTLEAGTYNLNLANTAGQENSAAQGDLDLFNIAGVVGGKTYTFNGAGPTTIINGNDCDDEIAGYHWQFLAALEAALEPTV